MSDQPGGLGGPSPRSSWARRIKRIFLDVGPLKESREYRLLWGGSFVSFVGSRLTFVAVPYQVFQITRSPLAVGLLGFLELIPIVSLSLYGGALADAIDRRRLLLITEALLAVCSLALAVNAFSNDPSLTVIYVVTFLAAGLYALGSPAFRSLMPILVRKDQLAASAALHSFSSNFSSVIGPALAGVLIATVGLVGTFIIDVATFIAALTAFWLMKPVPPDEGAEKPGLRSVLQGFRYMKGNQVIQGSFVVDLIAMVFGMPNALFPAVASRLGGPQILGLLYAAPSVGALLATLTSGWTKHVHRQGLAVYVAVTIWGAAIAVFGLIDSLPLILIALAIAGGADMISGVFRSAILQASAPRHMLGRLSGLELTVVASGPSLGDLEAGALAALTSVRFSIVGGGLACIVGVGIMALLMPAFARYDTRNLPEA